MLIFWYCIYCVVHFDRVAAVQESISYCSYYSPRTPASVASHLKAAVPGFYPKTPASKLKKKLGLLLAPALELNLLVKYTPKDKIWPRAREMVAKSAKARSEVLPRNLSELYQTNFLYLAPDPSLPVISLPRPDLELNFELCALMHRFKKPKNYTWEMLNLLLCAANKKQRDDLRIHLYILPFDYDEIELLEQVLEFGFAFAGLRFPFKPDTSEAKGFLGRLALGK